MAAVWKQISYNFLFFLAGLQSIPKSLIEAAAIDGAGPGRRFWTIVFPLLSPTTFFLLVVNIVYAFFETFAIVDAVTQGGPGQETSILVYKVYHDGFKGMDLGGSAAQSVVLMVIVITLDGRAVPLRRATGATTDGLVEAPPLACRADPSRAAGRVSQWSRFRSTSRSSRRRRRPRRSSRRRCRWFRATFCRELSQGAVRGATMPASRAPVGRMMWVSLVRAVGIALGKIIISLLSAFAIVYFRFPLPQFLLLGDLRHADAAGRSAHRAHLPGRCPTSAC